MFRLFLIYLLFFIFFSIPSYGISYDFVIDNLQYKVDLSTMEATLVGANGSLIYADIPSTVAYNNRTFTVVKIGEKCFCGKTLYSLFIPKTIKEIGEYAFYDCDKSRIKSKKIIIPSSVEVIQAWNLFNGCDTLVVEDSLIPLKWGSHNNMFKGLMNCTYLYIGRDITTKSGNSFYGLVDCDRIKELIFGDLVSFSHVSMTYYSINDIKYNGKNQFNLETIVLGKSMNPKSGIQYCPNLKKIISRNEHPLPFERYEYSDIEDPFTTSQYMNVKLYIPKGSKEYYMETDGWSFFFNMEEAEVYPVKVIAKNYQRKYGEANPFYEYEIEGANLDGHPYLSCEASEDSPIGKYTIQIEMGTIKNPCVDFVNGSLYVTKAPLVISAKTYTKEQGEENPPFELEYKGFMNGETADVLTRLPDVICYATKNSPIGEYPVIVRDAEADNYEITYINGVLIIEKTDAIDEIKKKKCYLESIHNLNGFKIHQPQRGVNIIRMKDGNTRKVLVK